MNKVLIIGTADYHGSTLDKHLLDNEVSTYTLADATWNFKRDIPDDVIHYTYKSKFPHYGTGKWIAF